MSLDVHRVTMETRVVHFAWRQREVGAPAGTSDSRFFTPCCWVWRRCVVIGLLTHYRDVLVMSNNTRDKTRGTWHNDETHPWSSVKEGNNWAGCRAEMPWRSKKNSWKPRGRHSSIHTRPNVIAHHRSIQVEASCCRKTCEKGSNVFWKGKLSLWTVSP